MYEIALADTLPRELTTENVSANVHETVGTGQLPRQQPVLEKLPDVTVAVWPLPIDPVDGPHEAGLALVQIPARTAVVSWILEMLTVAQELFLTVTE